MVRRLARRRFVHNLHHCKYAGILWLVSSWPRCQTKTWLGSSKDVSSNADAPRNGESSIQTFAMAGRKSEPCGWRRVRFCLAKSSMACKAQAPRGIASLRCCKSRCVRPSPSDIECATVTRDITVHNSSWTCGVHATLQDLREYRPHLLKTIEYLVQGSH